jgi:hypothetical protein
MVTNLQNHCFDFSRDIENDGSILAISNSAGGGHKEATKAACAQFFEQQQSHKIPSKKLKGTFKTVDIFQGSFPPLINKLFAYGMSYQWNKAKREGNIEAQERLFNGKIMGIAKSILIDWILFIPVFVSTFFRLVFNRKITHVVITQPLGLKAIIKAARAVNFLFKRKIRLSMIFTDLPTEGAIHYCKPLKKLCRKDKQSLTIITTKPLKLDPKESDKDWWKRVCGLNYSSDEPSKNQVLYREFPLRPAFLKWKDVPADDRPDHLEIKLNNSEEYRLINQLMNKQLKKQKIPNKKKEVVSINVDPTKDRVGLVTIGSQAATKTKNYVIDFINVAKSLPQDRNYFFFVACGKHEPGKNTLFKEVYDECIKAELPTHIRVIPMGYQDDDEFAPMMHRMDFGIGSTGGLTSFEFLRTAKHKVFLHSEAETKIHTQKNLLKGFSLWEKWNALYQIHEKGAEIVTPGQLFTKALTGIIQVTE